MPLEAGSASYKTSTIVNSFSLLPACNKRCEFQVALVTVPVACCHDGL